MNWTAVRLGAGLSKATRLTALALSGGLLAAGCRGNAGGGGGGTGINATDEHGNTPLEATVVIPDGPGDDGQVNFVGDIDWFKYRGIAGVGYALQIHGFPPDPDVRPDLDLNGNGNDRLTAQIIGADGSTQLVNSSGTQGGSPVDIDAAGLDPGSRGGDSRFFWICPTTQDYFFSIRHRRNGIGAYRFRLASSQFTTIENFDFSLDSQTGGRQVTLFDDQGALTFSGFVTGVVWWPGIEFIESLANTDISDIVAGTDPVILAGNTDPETQHLHAHLGFPNVFFPEESFNDSFGDPPHPTIFDVAIGARRSFSLDPATGLYTGEGTIRFANGWEGRVPITIDNNSNMPSSTGTRDLYRIHLADAIIRDARGSEVTLTESFFRTMTGFDWYFDVHPQPDMDADPLPVTVSRPLADMYEMFETPLEANASNVVLRDGTRLPEDQRGSQFFNIYYDSSLKLFQVATQIYVVQGLGSAGVFQADYASFVGDRVKVHAGAPGTTGPEIIDLGTLPPIRAPRSASPAFSRNTSIEPEGFRQPIRQITDPEVDSLREAFYDQGFYVEVTDQFTGEPIMRAEGFLGISIFPTLEPCSFPPCSGAAPIEKPKRGSVAFASGLAGEGPVDLYVNGKLLGQLNETVTPDNLPACGLDGDNRTLAAELWPGTYYWHAHSKSGKTWSGHTTVSGDACQLVVIDPDDLNSQD